MRNKKLFLNFLKIWAITTVCSGIPFLTFGLVFGAISQTLAAVIITLFFAEELS